MRRMIAGVDLGRTHIALLASHQGAPVIFSMFVQAALEAGYDPAALRGTIQNEFLSFYEALPRSTAYPPADAVRIVADVTGLDADAARALLQLCDGEVKTALVAHARGVAPEAARRALADAGGRVREALE